MSLLSLFMFDHPFIFSVCTVLTIFRDHRVCGHQTGSGHQSLVPAFP